MPQTAQDSRPSRATRQSADDSETPPSSQTPASLSKPRHWQPVERLHRGLASESPSRAPRPSNHSRGVSLPPLHPAANCSSAPTHHSCSRTVRAQILQKLRHQVPRYSRAISRRGSNVVNRPDLRGCRLSCQLNKYWIDPSSLHDSLRLHQTKRNWRHASHRKTNILDDAIRKPPECRQGHLCNRLCVAGPDLARLRIILLKPPFQANGANQFFWCVLRPPVTNVEV